MGKVVGKTVMSYAQGDVFIGAGFVAYQYLIIVFAAKSVGHVKDTRIERQCD
jgi:hypothetical protein